ncbi:MAG: RNA polymerase sigma factor [Firmicutes bacterium]|nr:RNA polymerase sigma factor [Bacillota bacterium]
MNNFAKLDFNAAVNKYSDTIIRIAFQYTKNRADAEDIMQDVFFSLIKQPPFSSEEHLKAWIIRVTINKSRNYYKASKKRQFVSLESVSNSLTAHQTEKLSEVMELPEDDRNIIYLFYYEGYKAKEIAKILDKKEKAVLMRLGRAREKLKYLLEVQYEN